MRSEGHDFSGLWFNPNIHPYGEYKLRLDSLKKLSKQWDINIHYLEEYQPWRYFRMFNNGYKLTDLNDLNSLNGLNNLNIPPFPDRCKFCYQLRLDRTAEHAQEQGFDAFSTTLLISPYQDFRQIVATGEKLAEKYKILFYSRDFRAYFRDAMALSKELGLYRQKYCGCIFSKEERNQKKSKIN
jgi:hypothetical protein